MSEACSNCRFWDQTTTADEPVGDCRRRAPLVSDELLRLAIPGRGFGWSELDDYVYEASAFPVTAESSWCGEYEATSSPPSPVLTSTEGNPVRRAVAIAGSQAALAKICGCSQGAISQMLQVEPPKLSAKFVPAVEAATGVPRWDLRPDIYPPTLGAGPAWEKTA